MTCPIFIKAFWAKVFLCSFFQKKSNLLRPPIPTTVVFYHNKSLVCEIPCADRTAAHSRPNEPYILKLSLVVAEIFKVRESLNYLVALARGRLFDLFHVIEGDIFRKLLYRLRHIFFKCFSVKPRGITQKRRKGRDYSLNVVALVRLKDLLYCRLGPVK